MKEQNIPLKTSLEVNRMRRPGKLIAAILSRLKNRITEGITTREIEEYCQAMIARGFARSSAKGYGGFPSVICTSVNNIAVHGVPNDTLLIEGDILTVDISLNIEGWHGDSALTFIVGKGSRDIIRLKKTALSATLAGIKAARAGNRLGDIGWAIEKTARRWGCSVIDLFAGHGIGLNLHENPLVLSAGEKATGLPIVPGMVFTIEPVITLGTGKVKPLGDGWGYITADGNPTAQYEHTIAVFSDRTDVLTDEMLSFNYSSKL